MKKIFIHLLYAIFLVVFFSRLDATPSLTSSPKFHCSYVDDHNTSTIKSFKDQQLSSVETLVWHPENSQLLSERILEDADRNVLLHQKLVYDGEGNLLQERILNEKGELFSIDSTELAGKTSFPTAIPPKIGCWEAENLDRVKITFVHGILNTDETLAQSLNLLCNLHGNTSIHYVFKESEGVLWDLFRSTLIRSGCISPEAYALAELWKELIQEMGGVNGGGHIIHYAHSIGGGNTYGAKFLLSEEEQQMIEVITLGSPTILPNEGFKSVLNYMSLADAILFMDPLSHLHAFFSNEDGHIIYVGDSCDMCVEDHLIEGKSYKSVLESCGQTFIELYKNHE